MRVLEFMPRSARRLPNENFVSQNPGQVRNISAGVLGASLRDSLLQRSADASTNSSALRGAELMILREQRQKVIGWGVVSDLVEMKR